MPFLLFFLLIFSSLAAEMSLQENLKKTRAGDYIVAAQGKNISLLRVAENNGQQLTLEEISAPVSRCQYEWKSWAQNGALGHTSWVLYKLEISSGRLLSAYSFTKGSYFQIPATENFLGTLMTLKLTPIPQSSRKKVGPEPMGGPDFRRIWQPKMVFEGKEVPKQPFSAWKTRWPKDGSELSDRAIVIYLPESERYPCYFPYWLEISGFIGKAKVRIIDSGENLFIPPATYQHLTP